MELRIDIPDETYRELLKVSETPEAAAQEVLAAIETRLAERRRRSLREQLDEQRKRRTPEAMERSRRAAERILARKPIDVRPFTVRELIDYGRDE